MRLLTCTLAVAVNALTLTARGIGGGRRALLDHPGEVMRGSGKRISRIEDPSRRSTALETDDSRGTGRQRVDLDTARPTRLKRDRVRPHVWERVTARFNAIAENCAGVWKL